MKSDADSLLYFLLRMNVIAMIYHAKLNPNEKIFILNNWAKTPNAIMIATNASIPGDRS